MSGTKAKLELTWVGKENRPKLEPRILEEMPEHSYGDPNSGNMLIHGDNLLVLKALEQDFAGKVKCIFIDPPYNTGSAFSHYDDGLEHSIWLTMMRDRLEMLRRLLRGDGSIWITIDDNEAHYLKVLCDEVFGRHNFVANIVWQKAYTSNQTAKHLSNTHDHVLLYARHSEAFAIGKVPRTDEQIGKFSNPDDDPRGPWKAENLSAGKFYAAGQFQITGPNGGKFLPPKGRYWRCNELQYSEWLRDGRISFGMSGTGRPMLKKFLRELEDGLTANTWWNHDEVGSNKEASIDLKEMFGDRQDVFQNPKPEKLAHRILTLASSSGDLVLDSFAGSGTTGAVAQKMGRRWILVELGDHVYSHIIPRMKKVIDGQDPGGITEAVGWQGGGGFKFYQLAESLLVKERELSTPRRPIWVINSRYDSKMLVRAICKIENFHYTPDLRWDGASSEHHFLHVTTKLVTQKYLDSLVDELAPEEALLVYCTRRVSGVQAPDQVELKKIPKDLLGKCEFDEEKR